MGKVKVYRFRIPRRHQHSNHQRSNSATPSSRVPPTNPRLIYVSESSYSSDSGRVGFRIRQWPPPEQNFSLFARRSMTPDMIITNLLSLDLRANTRRNENTELTTEDELLAFDDHQTALAFERIWPGFSEESEMHDIHSEQEQNAIIVWFNSQDHGSQDQGTLTFVRTQTRRAFSSEDESRSIELSNDDVPFYIYDSNNAEIQRELGIDSNMIEHIMNLIRRFNRR